MNQKSEAKASSILLGLFWIYQILTRTLGFSEKALLKPTLEKLLSATLAQVALVVVIFWILKTWTKTSLHDYGLQCSGITKQLTQGTAWGLGLFALMTFFVRPLFNFLIPESSSTEGLEVLFRGGLPTILIWFFLSVVGGGFSEELERVLGLTLAETAFGKWGRSFALILSSIAFGLGHLYQGVSAAVTLGILGFLWGLYFLKTRSLISVMVCHAIFDLAGVLGAFLLYAQ